jgi:hypothetical protein
MTLRRHLLSEGVFHFFSRLCEVAASLIGISFVLDLRVARRSTDGRLDRARDYLPLPIAAS